MNMGRPVKKIHYKKSPGAKPSAISLLELKQLIVEERLPPKAMIQDDSLTSGHWRSLADLGFFQRIKQINEYLYGDMIEKVYRLGSLQFLVDSTGATAATRLYVLKSDLNERICTVQFFEQGNVIETALGGSCLRNTLTESQQSASETNERTGEVSIDFDARDIRYHKTTIYREQMPEVMSDWQTFQNHLASAGPCSCDLPDCLECRHTSFETASGTFTDVLWSNPLAEIHPQQSRIVGAYFSIASQLIPD
jgi:hypothetical protein